MTGRTQMGSFTILPDWVRTHEGLSSPAIMLYLTLASYADNRTGKCWPSKATLANELSTSANSVSRWAKELEDAGVIEVEHRKSEANLNLTNMWTIIQVDPKGTPTHGGRVPPPVGGRTIPIELDKDYVNEDVDRVWFAWLDSTGKNPKRAKLDAKRKKLIAKALADYTVGEVVAAVTGWEFSPHHRGENERGTKYNDLSLLLRNPENIERFRDLHSEPPAPLASTTDDVELVVRPPMYSSADDEVSDAIPKTESAKNAAKIRQGLRK